MTHGQPRTGQVPHERDWESLPQFTLCRRTGVLAERGECPIDGGDACLEQFVSVPNLRPKCELLRADRDALAEALRDISEFYAGCRSAWDGTSPCVTRARAVLAVHGSGEEPGV